MTTTRASLAVDENDDAVVSVSETLARAESTDRDALESMSDDEVSAAAADDPDARGLTPVEHDRLRPVLTPRAIRRRLGLTQTAFADRFGISVATLRDREQGRRMLDLTARTLLLAIDADPELIAGVVRSARTVAAWQPASPTTGPGADL